MQQRHKDYWWWVYCEISAPLLALFAVKSLQRGELVDALMAYGVATYLSIRAGGLLKSIGEGAQEVARLNDRYHKWSVFTLNGLMAIGCVDYLSCHLAQARLPVAILAMFFTLYILSWAMRIIRPHSLLARFRSVLARVVLTTVIAGIMWKHGYWLVPLCSIPVLVVVWRHLRRDQQKFGWNTW